MGACNDFITISPPSIQSNPVEVEGIVPITVEKRILGDKTKFIVSTNLVVPDKGVDGKPGEAATISIGTVTNGPLPLVVNSGTPQHAILDITLPIGETGKPGVNIKGDKGDTPQISVGNVTTGLTASVVNTGTPTDVVLAITLPKADKGDKGDSGLTKGLSNYVLATGNLGGSYLAMGNFNQGNYVDLGDNPQLVTRKVRIKAWVTVANMQNWTTLRLTRGNQTSFNNTTLISQRVYHSEATLYVGQKEISAYIETTDRYIGFTFSDTPGGNYNSDGEQYGDYGVEAFVLS